MDVRKIDDTMIEAEKQGDRATPSISVRPFTASDVDFVISRQLALYKSEYGFASEIWNAYLTEGVHNFVKHFDPGKDCMNILKNKGVPVGCIAITHVDTATAQLRFFFIESEMRGQGCGHQLMNLAISFCREKSMSGYFCGHLVPSWLHDTCMKVRDFSLPTCMKIPTGAEEF
jgi:GNAT superfamily N-acetyltransferase